MRIPKKFFEPITAIMAVLFALEVPVAGTPLPNSCPSELSVALGVIDRMGSRTGKMGGLMDFRDPRLFSYLEEKMTAGDRTLGTESGAAQIVLAEIGHKGAYEEIAAELRHEGTADQYLQAFRKIKRLRREVVFPMLVSMLQVRSASELIDLAEDYAYATPEYRASSRIRRLLVESGVPENSLPSASSEHIEDWRTWGRENASRYPAGPFLEPLPDAQAEYWANLFRLVEASGREPQHLLELGASGEVSLVCYLRARRKRPLPTPPAHVAEMPDDRRKRYLEQVRDSFMRRQSAADPFLQMAIAKLGGDPELKEVAAELTSGERATQLRAVEKLEYVADGRAVEVLRRFERDHEGDEAAREAVNAAREALGRLELESSSLRLEPMPVEIAVLPLDAQRKFSGGPAETDA